MHLRHSRSAFTLVEILVAAGIFGTVALAILSFMSTSVRLIIRNLATNHSHEAVRISGQKMLADLHDSASRFRLVDFNGTTYSDVAQTVTTDQDSLSGQYSSTRTNGVRFYKLAAGPCPFMADALTTATDLQFDFGVAGGPPYLPQVGDRLVIPLINREYGISQVVTAPTSGNTRGTIRIDDSAGLGFSITTGTDKLTTAYFYRKVAYTVFNNQLRYHPNYEGTARSNFIPVRDNITSPKPFALLYPAATSPSSDALNLRLSLESADLQYSARNLRSSTTTLLTIIPPRNQPPQIGNTN